MSFGSFLGSILFACLLFTPLSLAAQKLFYDFDVKDFEGETFHLSSLKGTVSLVVNVASQCGYTDGHYKALTKLQQSLGGKGKFQVLAFPCNQFGQQEPGSIEEIMQFAQENYNINFKIFDKIDVTGPDADPAFDNLIEQSGKAPNWNFWKYLVNGEGLVLHAWGPKYSVDAIFDDVMRAVGQAGGSVESTLGEKGFGAGEEL
uniref:Glutathione peroxidase n=1 Tax=Plectus sambesii TaxID=2011161 RepID=A0A914XM97_9BILA